jgi:PRTRC genetic system protein B
MNDSQTNKRFFPSMAVIVYRDKNQYQPNCYLEKREIKLVGDKFRMMAPVPMEDDALKEIAKIYTKTRASDIGFGGLISPHLLYGINKSGITAVMWYRPAMKRSLNFSSQLKIKSSVYVSVPPTLYLVKNKDLYVFALMTDERPDLKTKIYKAPYFNIYEDGRVCLGTARVGNKENTYEKEADRFERGFYMAEQNGGNVDHNCKTPLAKLWNNLIKTTAAFPSKKELIQHPKYKTVGELMQKMIGNNSIEQDDEDYEEEDQ